MTLIDIKTVTKYLLASILVGVVLGISGAFAAQGFRSGIVIITEYLELFLSSQPNFLFFLITLSIALVFVHYSRIFINGKPFKVSRIAFIWLINLIMRQMSKLEW